MTDYRKIMSLLLAGHSYREIEARARASQKTIAVAKKKLHTEAITPERFAVMSDAEITELFPDGRARVSAEYLPLILAR